MINGLCKYLLGKEIVIYTPHRQTLPLAEDTSNRKKYIFVNSMLLWRILPIPGRYKLKFRVVYMLLSLVAPTYILDINWTSKWHSLYKVWTKNHPKSRFVVVQHGTYVGGIVTDIAHRYTKCDVFLTWSDYFTRMFKQYNTGKKTRIITFGNPVYNQYDRAQYSYKDRRSGSILIAPSVVSRDRQAGLHLLHEKLTALGFSVFLKEHGMQAVKSAPITGITKIQGNIFEILLAQNYDLIIADHGSLLLDAIFFKNRCLIYSGPGPIPEFDNNIFTDSLPNLYGRSEALNSKEDLYNFAAIDAQEELFQQMVSVSANRLPSSFI